MNIQQFLEHHGVRTNPFSEEDAQTDPVFKEHCITSTHHPTWDKIYGDPSDPATAVVFGEKGSGKTALRLQMARHVADYNRTHPNQRLLVIEYDDFNPFLDHFRDRLPPRNRTPERLLAQWKLWDHMDAILSLGVTRLVDRILHGAVKGQAGPLDVGPLETGLLDRHRSRDLLLLAAFYDQSTAETFYGRWQRLRRKLKFRTWRTWWQAAVGWVVTIAVAAVIIWQQWWTALATPWPYVIAVAGWLPWLARVARWTWRSWGVTRQLQVMRRQINPLRRALMQFTPDEIGGQPLPDKDRTDDRFELLSKFQGVLGALGYAGVVVLVDRVDEPHMINGSPERMKALVWPLLDNKLLKHTGVGFKLLLPLELSYYITREDRDFYQRARLDKQNMIPSLDWTGEALYDIANARLAACASDGKAPTLRDLFDEGVTETRLLAALRSLRVPRHLFRFLYRTFVAHTSSHTVDRPCWKISPETFESTLAIYQRDQDAMDRGAGAG